MASLLDMPVGLPMLVEGGASEEENWRRWVRALARAAFYSRRPSGVLARLVHDSVLDADGEISDHELRFEHDHDLTIRLRVRTLDDRTSLSGKIEPAGSRRLVLHRSGPGQPLESTESESGRFSFPPVSHGLVRMRLDGPEQAIVWSDWFRV